jgi:hypothetical protein
MKNIMKNLSASTKAALSVLTVILILIIIMGLSITFPKIMVAILFSTSVGIFLFSFYKLFKNFFDNQ